MLAPLFLNSTIFVPVKQTLTLILPKIFTANFYHFTMVFKRLFLPRGIYLFRNFSTGAPKDIPNETFNKAGDGGTSKTLTGETLPKDNYIFEAIGATEELLSCIGLAREHAHEAEHEYTDKLKRIQTVIIDLSTAISRKNDPIKKPIPTVYTKELEDWIHEYSKELPPPEQYIIPGGGIASAALHLARSVCRRTERVVQPLVREGSLDREAQIYLNRLSDFLFTVSRIATKLDQRTESIYIPKPDEKVQTQ